jgi:hypothetical protein
MAFVDANAALALAAGGEEAALGRLTDGLRCLEAQGHPTAGAVVLPLVQDITVFVCEDYEEAIRWLEPIIEHIARIGGSNAQREVFTDTLLEAYLRAGHYDKAEVSLRQRLTRRPFARDLFWLGRAQVGRGNIESAAISLSEGCLCWENADPEAAEQVTLGATQRQVEMGERC